MGIVIAEVNIVAIVCVLGFLATVSYCVFHLFKHATINPTVSMIELTRKGRNRFALASIFLVLVVSSVRIFFFEEVREHPITFFVIAPIVAVLVIWTISFVYLFLEHLALNSCIHRHCMDEQLGEDILGRLASTLKSWMSFHKRVSRLKGLSFEETLRKLRCNSPSRS